MDSRLFNRLYIINYFDYDVYGVISYKKFNMSWVFGLVMVCEWFEWEKVYMD